MANPTIRMVNQSQMLQQSTLLGHKNSRNACDLFIGKDG